MLAQCMLCLGLVTLSGSSSDQYTCNSPIYCYGRLLRTIQLAGLYPDSKTFVDKKMKFSYYTTLHAFEELMESVVDKPTNEEVQLFLDEHFEDGHELEVADPLDWSASPDILYKISDPELRKWARKLNAIWLDHTRKISREVDVDYMKYSLIYVPNKFVVPGGRFREFYYWDTYWIVRGLLLCGMKETVRGMLENFFQMISMYSFVPNGGRIYYYRRSQPPLLIPMVLTYYEETEDLDFLYENIDFLHEEFDFWYNERTVQVEKNGKKYTLARYNAVSYGPRPESYKEDFKLAHDTFGDDEERIEEFYADIKSAAESGWDFSSRWYIVDGTNKGKLSDIQTRNIIPVDLNSWLYMNAQTLSMMYEKVGDMENSEYFGKLAKEWKEAVNAVLWNEKEGMWFDYDILNGVQRVYYYASNLTPLWTRCYDHQDVASIAQQAVNYLNKYNITKYKGGIPTSQTLSKEQWDFPNAWPPLQAIVIQGLYRTQQPVATDLAYQLAKNWVLANYEGFQQSGVMFEKYDAEKPGDSGHHGEYDPQSGFGWTNGVIFELLDMYGDKLRL